MSQKEPVLFSEAQPLGRGHTRIVLAFPPAALLFMTIRQMVFHKPWGKPPMADGGLIFLTVLLTAVYFRLITVKLVTVLRPDELSVALRGFWRRRRIPLREIRSAELATYDAMTEFGGYGIRSGRRGSAYIARGNQGVELTLTDGHKVLIGSRKSEELLAKIDQARQRFAA
jgi:hypothetical protein